MKSFITGILEAAARPVMHIHAGERKKTFLMFAFFSLIISLVYILKPVRSSLFLGEFGAEKLPYVYIGEGVWLIFVVWLYTFVAKRVSRMALYVGVLLFMISNLCLLWILFGKSIDYLSAFFYIWVASFSITMTTVFWTLANDIFNPAEAKRLFGIIISGGSLGGILGGVITNKAVAYIKTEDLLLLSCGILVFCICCVAMLSPEIKAVGTHGEALKPPSSANLSRNKSLKLLRASSYLLMLAAIVIIAKVASTVVDAQFSKAVEISISGKEARTAYFGAFWAWLNGISFCMQFFVISFLLRFLGVGFSLWFLPAGLGFFSALSFVYPGLWSAQFLRIFDGSANYSIQLAAKETLYLPLSSALRHRVKPIIDMLGFRTAKTLGGFLILAATTFAGISFERLGILVVLMIPFWLYVAWRMKKAYSKLLRSHLLNRRQYDKAVETYKATDVLSFMHDEKTFHEIRNFMSHRSTYARKLAAAAYFAYAKSSNDLKTAQRILRGIIRREAAQPTPEDAVQGNSEERDVRFLSGLISGAQNPKETFQSAVSLKELLQSASSENILMKISEIIRSPAEELEVKRRAVRILEYLPDQKTADLLLHRLADCEEHALRFLMVRALIRIRKKSPRITVSRILVKSEIAREMTLYDQILKVRNFYHKELKSSPGADDYADIALRAILDENLERIFLCLKLLYPGEAISTIYEEFAESAGDRLARAHAAELLANTLEPDLLIMLERLLNESRSVRWNEHEIKNTLKSFARSRDHWFSLIAYFLITGLKLDQRWPELEEFKDYSGHPFFVQPTA